MDTPFSETEVGVLHPAGAFEQESGEQPVTHLHVLVDGDQDEEVTLLSSWAGASSEEAASGGVPSAETQHQQSAAAGLEKECEAL